MPFAIMRCAKLNNAGNVAAALQHCYRERETPNADDARTPNNEHLISVNVLDAQNRMKELLPEKRRKDAVIAVEYVFTASPEWFQQNGPQTQQVFFDRSVDWLAEKYGRDRIVVATIHRDETTPHLSAFVVPLTQDGRLSAKEFIGGKDKMRADQSTFAAAVADLGLERGIEGSQAQHQTIRQYYTALNQGIEQRISIEPGVVVPQKTGLFAKESPEQVAERVGKQINGVLTNTFLNASVKLVAERKLRSANKTIAVKQEALERAEKRIQNAEAPFKGLNPQQAELIRTLADNMRKENQERRKEQQRTRDKDRALGR